MEQVLFLCFCISFILTLALLPKWIRKAKEIGLVGTDMHKFDKPKVPESGGVVVIFGTTFGILAYIFLSTFLSPDFSLVEIFAVLTTVLLAGFIGFIDDILGWKSGISQSAKVLSTFPIAIPLLVISAGSSGMILPFIGVVNFGILFPLLIVPIIVVGATNGFNMLAGYNGLEAGLGMIILSTLGTVAWLTGSAWVAMLAFTMVASLGAFLIFNVCPARVFPGDSLTYAVGAMIACIAILGNMEGLAFILFIPFFIDALFYVRAKFNREDNVEAFAKVNEDGSLTHRYDKVYDFTHLSLRVLSKIKGKVHENTVVMFVLGIVIILAIMGGLMYV